MNKTLNDLINKLFRKPNEKNIKQWQIIYYVRTSPYANCFDACFTASQENRPVAEVVPVFICYPSLSWKMKALRSINGNIDVFPLDSVKDIFKEHGSKDWYFSKIKAIFTAMILDRKIKHRWENQSYQSVSNISVSYGSEGNDKD